MLPITLEIPNQINLFQTRESSFPHFELQVINEGLFPEVRLYYLENKKARRTKVHGKKYLREKYISSLKRNGSSLSVEYPHVIKLAV
ncbi:MAG: hypothetical protein WC879_14390 [Melioribacteraceae bacterium]